MNELYPWGPYNRWRKSDNRFLLDFLSDDARRSISDTIVGSIAEYMRDSREGTSYYFLSDALKKHALAGILSESWQFAVCRSLNDFVMEYMEEHNV